MTTEHYIVIGLVALAAWLHRAKILGSAVVQEVKAIAPVVASYIPPAPAPSAPAPAAPTIANLLSLVHHQSEADALQKAHETAAQAIVDAKATSKAAGLPWTVLAPPATPTPPAPVSPPVATVPNP